MSSSRGGQRQGAGRKSPWKNGETQTIRVPKALAVQLLEIARRLDNGEVVDFVTKQNDSVTKTKKKRTPKNNSVTNSKTSNVRLETLGVIQPLPARALARRLGVSDTALMNHRDGKHLPGIPEWTRGLDPEGLVWEYREETKKYHPLPKN